MRIFSKRCFFLKDEVKCVAVAKLSPKQLENWQSCLSTNVIYNRIILYASKKLKDYQESRLDAIFYALNLVFLLCLTVLIFAEINYGLYKSNPNLYKTVGHPGFFSFVYYSFRNYLFSSIDEISPIAQYSQIMVMIESFFAMLFGIIFVSLLFSVRTDKYRDELTKTIQQLKAEGDSIKNYISVEFQLSFEEALVELYKVQKGTEKIVTWLSQRLD